MEKLNLSVRELVKGIYVTGIAVLSSPVFCNASVGYTGSYFQDFDGLGSGEVTWVQDTTLPGWTITAEASESSIAASTGSSTGGAIYNYGAASADDRALGYLGSSSNDWTNFYLTLENTTGFTINSLTIRFRGELWRSAGPEPDDSNNLLAFYYALGSVELVDGASVTGWTAVPELNYDPIVTQSVGAQDGNALSTTIEHTLAGLSWENGEILHLRWAGANGSGSDAGVAIDDVSVIPEPAALSLLPAAAFAWVLRRKRRACCRPH
jgi:hypothetical protein